jgi:hypothetical protein
MIRTTDANSKRDSTKLLLAAATAFSSIQRR